MNKLTDEQLAKIQEYASFFLTVNEIAFLIDVNANELKEQINIKNNPVYIAYNKGKLITKVALRKNIIKMALHGSPQAELLTEEFIKKQRLTEV